MSDTGVTKKSAVKFKKPVAQNAQTRAQIEAFHAISLFVNELWNVYGTRKAPTPLALYHRLLEHVSSTDVEGMIAFVKGFSDFVTKYETALINNDLTSIPRGERVTYGVSNTVYLEIQKYIHQADEDTREVIRQHLLTISTILAPNDRKVAELESRLAAANIKGLNFGEDSPESEFLTGIMSKAKNTMETVDTSNPMAAIMGMVQSGILQDMFTGLQTGVESGKMDMQKLLGTMQTAIGALMPQQTSEAPAKVDVIRDRVDTTEGNATVVAK